MLLLSFSLSLLSLSVVTERDLHLCVNQSIRASEHQDREQTKGERHQHVHVPLPAADQHSCTCTEKLVRARRPTDPPLLTDLQTLVIVATVKRGRKSQTVEVRISVRAERPPVYLERLAHNPLPPPPPDAAPLLQHLLSSG